MKTKRIYEDAFEAAKTGKLEEIPAELRVRHYQTWKRVAVDFLVAQPAEEVCTGVWLWGESGTGKSTYARENYPEYYLKAANKWWDGYQGQENVLLEDLGLEHKCLGHHLKLWCDKWDFAAEYKGGSLQIRPKKFVITSQYSIEQIWEDEETRAAVRRRCVVQHFNKTL